MPGQCPGRLCSANSSAKGRIMPEQEERKPDWNERPQNLDITETPLEPAYSQLDGFTNAAKSAKILGTLWLGSTWIYRLFGAHPRFFLTSEDPDSGKTTFLKVLIAMSQNGVRLSMPTERWIALWIEQNPTTTIGLDEVDKIYRRKDSRPTLTGLVNEGYTSSGMTGAQRDNQAVLLPCYCPIALAAIGNPLPKDTYSRCITVVMSAGVPAMQYRPDTKHHNVMLRMIGIALGELLNSEGSRTELARISELCDDLASIPGSTRAREIHFPLDAIAKLFGMHDQYLKAVRDNAVQIDASPVRATWVIMRDDLREVWPEDEPMLTAQEVIALLTAHPSQRWGHSLPNDAAGIRMLASALGQVGITTQARKGSRGYARSNVFA